MHPAPVRVVLVDMSRLTRDLIRSMLEAQPGIEVVREVPDHALPLHEVIEASEAEVTIVADEAPDLVAECRAWLGQRRPRRLIVVSADGREARLYGVRSYEASAEELSAEFVVDAVRNS